MSYLTLNESDIGKVITKAAKSALLEWGLEDGHDDLEQDLWLWYLERPATQRKIKPLSHPEAVATFVIAAFQILSDQILTGNVFNGTVLYSSESVKDVLKNRSTNRYLKDILPIAVDALDAQHPEYAEAIRSRYEDGDVPRDIKDQNALKRAHKSLIEHVNIIAITAGDVGKSAVFPETRKSKGGRADPTANTALLFLENPELKDDYFEETDEMWKVLDVQLV